MRIPRKVVWLGHCLEIRFTGGKTYRPGSSTLLCCSESRKTLWILPCKDKGTPFESPPKGKGSRVYKEWMDRALDRFKVARIDPKEGAQIEIHRVEAIVYRSNKKSRAKKSHEYIHTFKTLPKATVDSLKEPSFVRIAGGKLRVTRYGITG